MFESFVTAFIIYFVVIDPIGNAPIFLAVTEAQDRARKLRTALKVIAIATAIMLFSALCGFSDTRLSQHHRGRFQDRRRHHPVPGRTGHAGRQRQQRKRAESTGSGTASDAVDEEDSDGDNLAIYLLAIPPWVSRRPSCR